MNVDQLMMELETADLRRRNAVARAAAASATEDELRAVIRLLVNPVKNVRLGAMEVLAYARFRHAMPYLVDVTRKRTGDDRIMAARAIAAMAEPGDLELELFAKQWIGSGDPVLELHGTTVLMRLSLHGTSQFCGHSQRQFVTQISNRLSPFPRQRLRDTRARRRV
jgi:hypothetical protein